LVSNMRPTWWSKFIRAHVVLPVGRKANWSLMVSDGMAGFTSCKVSVRLSVTLQSTIKELPITVA